MEKETIKATLTITFNGEVRNTFNFEGDKAEKELAKILYSKYVYLTKTKITYKGYGKLNVVQDFNNGYKYTYNFVNCNESF